MNHFAAAWTTPSSRGIFARARLTRPALLPALALLAALGCGSSGTGADAADPSGTVSCTISVSDGTAVVNKICYEGTGPILRGALEQQCRAQSDAGAGPGPVSTGSFTQAPCSHAGAVGGCLVGAGGVSQGGWYYAVSGISEAQVRQLCAGTGGTFVAP